MCSHVDYTSDPSQRKCSRISYEKNSQVLKLKLMETSDLNCFLHNFLPGKQKWDGLLGGGGGEGLCRESAPLVDVTKSAVHKKVIQTCARSVVVLTCHEQKHMLLASGLIS